jgi:serine/threonine protein kinase
MRPSEQISGMKLEGGWTVGQPLIPGPKSTGGNFSTRYLVHHDNGHVGFLKAMDYQDAFMHANAPEVLVAMGKAYLFEKNICVACRDRKLRRVVHAIDSGFLMARPTDMSSRVEYLIFEKADGDVRTFLDATTTIDTAFILRTLHHVTVAVDELHGVSMAHQDLKPSNVLVFTGGEGSKLCDLGRSWSADHPSPYDTVGYAGDRSYAPIEFLYRDPPIMNRDIRYGCDLYHLSSLIFFFFTRVHLNGLLAKHLSHQYLPVRWGDTYEAVLPYLHEAFERALQTLENELPLHLRQEILTIARELGNPDYRLRGHPLERTGHHERCALRRYISRFDNLAKREELNLG